MSKCIAITSPTSPLARSGVVFWLFLALLLTLAALIQLNHTVTASAITAGGVYAQVSAGEPSDHDCHAHGGVMAGSHCGSTGGCGAAIMNAPATVLALGAEAARVTVSDTVASGRIPSPFFHPPKLIVQS